MTQRATQIKKNPSAFQKWTNRQKRWHQNHFQNLRHTFRKPRYAWNPTLPTTPASSASLRSQDCGLFRHKPPSGHVQLRGRGFECILSLLSNSWFEHLSAPRPRWVSHQTNVRGSRKLGACSTCCLRLTGFALSAGACSPTTSDSQRPPTAVTSSDVQAERLSYALLFLLRCQYPPSTYSVNAL